MVTTSTSDSDQLLPREAGPSISLLVLCNAASSLSLTTMVGTSLLGYSPTLGASSAELAML